MRDGLTHKVVVVTGAAGRLGKRVVRRFAEEGAMIAAVIRSEEEVPMISFPEQGEGWAFPADLEREDMVRACFEQIAGRLGRVDALVHAVGTWEARPFEDTSLEQWEQIMRTNLTTTFLCFREAAKLMGDGDGQLIAFASQQGAESGRAQQAAYSASKAGLVRLVESVSEEYRGTGITAHAIAPSSIDYDGNGSGVAVDDLVDLCVALVSGLGSALNGQTIRAYGQIV